MHGLAPLINVLFREWRNFPMSFSRNFPIRFSQRDILWNVWSRLLGILIIDTGIIINNSKASIEIVEWHSLYNAYLHHFNILTSFLFHIDELYIVQICIKRVELQIPFMYYLMISHNLSIAKNMEKILHDSIISRYLIRNDQMSNYLACV